MTKLFFLFFLILPLNKINSADFCEYEITTQSDEVQYKIQKAIEVNDIKGHFIRVFKTETNHKNASDNCEGLKIKQTDFFGISDYVNKNGKVTGYSIATYEDGSKIFSNFSGISHTPKDQSKNGIVFSTIRISGGTGIYKGIIGNGKGKVEFNPEKGYSSGSTKLFYKIIKN